MQSCFLFSATKHCSEAISAELSLAIYSRPSEKWHKLYGSKYKLVFYSCFVWCNQYFCCLSWLLIASRTFRFNMADKNMVLSHWNLFHNQLPRSVLISYSYFILGHMLLLKKTDFLSEFCQYFLIMCCLTHLWILHFPPVSSLSSRYFFKHLQMPW